MIRTEEEIKKRMAFVDEQLQAIDKMPSHIQPFLREQDYKDLLWRLMFEKRILEWVLCIGIY